MAGSIGSEEGDIGFQIAPMVDVVFVLMLFFMASAGLQTVEKELGIQLPSGVSARASAAVINPIVIAIGSDGAVQINGASYDAGTSADLPLTREKLRDMMTYGGEDPVIIQPAPDVRHERVMKVLNACAAAGVKHLSFS